MLCRTGMGFGMLGLGMMEATAADLPLKPKKSHFAPKARRVIHLFMNGGPSHVDTFDPKPMLTKHSGKQLPMANLRTERKTGAAFASPYKFRKYGQSGIEVSEVFSSIAAHVDDLAVIRSMQTDIPAHDVATVMFNTGSLRMAKPSVGAWALYGLGSANENMPGYISLRPGGPPGPGRASFCRAV